MALRQLTKRDPRLEEAKRFETAILVPHGKSRCGIAAIVFDTENYGARYEIYVSKIVRDANEPEGSSLFCINNDNSVIVKITDNYTDEDLIDIGLRGISYGGNKRHGKRRSIQHLDPRFLRGPIKINLEKGTAEIRYRFHTMGVTTLTFGRFRETSGTITALNGARKLLLKLPPNEKSGLSKNQIQQLRELCTNQRPSRQIRRPSQMA